MAKFATSDQRRLTRGQRRAIILEQLQQPPEMSSRPTAEGRPG